MNPAMAQLGSSDPHISLMERSKRREDGRRGLLSEAFMQEEGV